MRGERFDAEGFSGVVAAEEKIDAEFFGGDGGPMRRFARNERVDIIFRDAVDFRAGASGNDADRLCLPRTEIEGLDRTARRRRAISNKLVARQ